MTTRPALPDDAVELAAQAFVYAYPLEYALREMAGFTTDHSTLPVGGPWNELHHARELLGPETEFVSPNNDTLYSLSSLDLRGGPLLLEVPETGSRYYVLQMIDAWSNNFAYVGTRSHGGDGGRFLLAAPGFAGEEPRDTTLIEAPTGIALLLGRIQVDGEEDLPAVKELQDRFSLRRLDGSHPSAAGLPEPAAQVPEELRWWETVRVELAAFPPPAEDGPLLAAFAPLGLGAADSPYVDPDPDLVKVLVEGESRGRATIEQLAKGGKPGPQGWTSAMHFFDYNRYRLGFGTIDSDEWKIADSQRAYATRAAAARAGLFGNHGYEADYELVYTDADGEPLDGANAYELRLSEPPPAGAFWSLTMYDVPRFLLVDNPIHRYSIGDRTPGLARDEDGALTIYLQADSPGADKESNWLPTPTGPFRPMMRIYGPQAPVLDGSYQLPSIQRVG
ncbi:MAG: DUF1254 domain-containing protein [Actinobacteria bacterium]|nr:DUF1254 domain-containing protein [Actinomycetota bacterium]